MFSKNPQVGIYGLVKLLEFLFLGFYTAKVLGHNTIKKISYVFVVGIIFESSLAMAQYFQQGSMGGLLYFFGERSFTSQTSGIANASLNGALVMRPYGTFPHPNVLAGYLTIVMTIVVSIFNFPASQRGEQFSIFKKTIYVVTLLIGTLALFLTMSRVAILLWTMIIIGWFMLKLFKRIRNNQSGITNQTIISNSLFIILFALFICSIIFLSPLRYRFLGLNFLDQAIIVRKDLATASLLMIKDRPIFGEGVNNFLINLPYYNKSYKENFLTNIQPVHNIFLLIASETGIIGLIFFVWFLSRTYKRIRNNESGPLRLPSRLGRSEVDSEARIREEKTIISNSLFIILTTVLVLGLFDHYWLTLQQGQLLFSFVLGMCWAKKI